MKYLKLHNWLLSRERQESSLLGICNRIRQNLVNYFSAYFLYVGGSWCCMTILAHTQYFNYWLSSIRCKISLNYKLCAKDVVHDHICMSFYYLLSLSCSFSVLPMDYLGNIWKEGWDFFSQNVNQHTEMYNLVSACWPQLKRHLQYSLKFWSETVLEYVDKCFVLKVARISKSHLVSCWVTFSN